MGFGIFTGLLILLRIILFFYFIATDGQYLSFDSDIFLILANNLIENQVFSASNNAPFEPEIIRLPGYPFFLAILSALGMEGPYWAIFWQEFIYSSTVLIFYVFGRKVFGENLARCGLVFLLLEPGGLVYPKYVLSEILFAPFFFTGILAVGAYLRVNKLFYLILSGFMMGIGALISPTILFFPLFIAICLLLFAYRQKKTWLHVLLMLVCFALVITPWLLRNHHYLGELSLACCQGSLLADYHVPMVWETVKSIPFDQAQAKFADQVKKTAGKWQFNNSEDLTGMEFFVLQQRIALEELARYPREYIQLWLLGVLKTMNGIHLTELYRAFHIHSDRIPSLQADVPSSIDKGYNLFSQQEDAFLQLIEWIRVMISAFAVLGVFYILKKRDCFLFLILLINCYFIILPGPMGFSRLRFPIEVFWFLQACMGFILAKNFFHLWRQKSLLGNTAKRDYRQRTLDYRA